MGALQEFEKRLGGAVEGFFARAFRSGVQPIELARAVQRYAEDTQQVTPRGVVVPNVYRIGLHDRDLERAEALGAALPQELAEVVAGTARERDWVLRGPVVVKIVRKDGVRFGTYELAGRIEVVESARGEPADGGPAARSRTGDDEQFAPVQGGQLEDGHGGPAPGQAPGAPPVPPPPAAPGSDVVEEPPSFAWEVPPPSQPLPVAPDPGPELHDPATDGADQPAAPAPGSGEEALFAHRPAPGDTVMQAIVRPDDELPSRSARFRLRVLSGGTPGHVVSLYGGRIVAGRLPGSGLVLDDATVSRQHAAFVRRGDEWWVVDLGSTNGTRVNDTAAAEQPLRPGDHISLGEAEVEFQEA